ncbi:MAG: L,D-transpeptidase family protein [Sedimentisphaerales bacterium]
MAVYPSGYNEHRSAQIRRILYVSIAVIMVAVIAIAGYILLRNRGGSQEVAPESQANMTEHGQPALPVAQMEPGVAKSAAGSVPSTSSGQASSPQATAPVAMDANGSVVSAQIAQAMELLNQSTPKVIEARDRLNELLPLARGQELVFIKTKLAELSDKWLFSKVVYPEDKLTASYKVASGDMLSTIGKKHNVPYEILMQINNMTKPEALQAGVAIKVINGPFHVRVYRSTFTMDLYLQNTYVKSFLVGLGKAGMETPTGRWRAKEGGKLIQPIWTDPVSGKTYHPEDPDYPLGSRWIALEGLEGAAVGKTGFAIHGTKNPEQIGTPGSQGCIRLHNGDAILVYNLMMPGQSLVDVVD